MKSSTPTLPNPLGKGENGSIKLQSPVLSTSSSSSSLIESSSTSSSIMSCSINSDWPASWAICPSSFPYSSSLPSSKKKYQ